PAGGGGVDRALRDRLALPGAAARTRRGAARGAVRGEWSGPRGSGPGGGRAAPADVRRPRAPGPRLRRLASRAGRPGSGHRTRAGRAPGGLVEPGGELAPLVRRARAGVAALSL